MYDETYSDLAHLVNEIKTYVPKDGERGVLISDLYRCQRYYNLINNLRPRLSILANKEIASYKQILTDAYKLTLQLTTTELGFTNTMMDEGLMQKAVNAVWAPDGRHWSDRVWRNKEALANDIQQGIVDIIAGHSDINQLSHRLKDNLNDNITKGYNAASRLARTELSFVQTQSALDRYSASNILYYKVLPALDACESCIDYTDIFKVDEAQVGINCPPFHPNCRCTIIPVIGGKQ